MNDKNKNTIFPVVPWLCFILFGNNWDKEPDTLLYWIKLKEKMAKNGFNDWSQIVRANGRESTTSGTLSEIILYMEDGDENRKIDVLTQLSRYKDERLPEGYFFV